MTPSAHRKPIRVLIVDDHPVVLTGVRTALSGEKGIEVVGVAASGSQALKMAAKLEPDVILMDISLPSMNGLEATERLRDKMPKTRVIAFTMHENKEYVHEAIRQGASGYVLKNTSTDELRRAIETVYRGKKYFSAQVSRLLLDQYVAQVQGTEEEPELSLREREILALIAAGMTAKEVATRTNLGIRTVDTHRVNLMKKLKIHTVAGLTRYAISKGLIKP